MSYSQMSNYERAFEAICVALDASNLDNADKLRVCAQIAGMLLAGPDAYDSETMMALRGDFELAVAEAARDWGWSKSDEAEAWPVRERDQLLGE
jgi:hypothetical protein